LVQTTERQLRKLSGASILITGATGWFGIWLLEALCAADDSLQLGIRITAVSRRPDAFITRFPKFTEEPRIRWIKADVRQLEAHASGFSHVIHAAAETSIGNTPAEARRLFETIVDGTRRAIDAAGKSCKSFLFLSSGAIYGPARTNRGSFSELTSGGPDPSLPKSAYAEGKRAAEQICTIAAGMGSPVRIARCFAFVGPHMPFDKHFAIGNFIADAVCGRVIRIKSDGRATRSYLYMTDLIRALICILVDGTVARTYNVGSDESVTIAQLARRVDRIVGGNGVLIEGLVGHKPDRYLPDTTRLRTELGCLPEVSLDTAVARTAAWYRAQSDQSMS
jgi:dTDP-glucose 4,6-dehydratase